MGGTEIAIARVLISTHGHATEDIDKVKQAIMNILPLSLRNRISIVEETTVGYYGNPIVRLKVVLEGDDAIDFVKNIFNLMSEGDKNVLLSTLDSRYNRKSNEIYIRLSKQDAYLGSATLYDGDDAIKIVITFAYKRSSKDVRKLIEDLIKGSTNNAS
jgi:RNA binding exosome subunit